MVSRIFLKILLVTSFDELGVTQPIVLEEGLWLRLLSKNSMSESLIQTSFNYMADITELDNNVDKSKTTGFRKLPL